MKLCFVAAGIAAMIALSLDAAPVSPSRETVVLLHGLGRTSVSMAPLACALRREGYHVVNVSYRSRTRSLEELATKWLPELLAESADSARIHIVTHSMGGILVRLWLRDHPVPANLGRVVMLAPPNAGSEIPDRLSGVALFRWMTGTNGYRLGTGRDDVPKALGSWPAPAHSLGVIAGNRSFNPLLGAVLPRPNDGKVSVASTHLAGESDHIVLPYSHTWLGWRQDTLSQVSTFLRSGRFSASTP